MNVELKNRIKQFILDYPQGFNIYYYFSNYGKDEVEDTEKFLEKVKSGEVRVCLATLACLLSYESLSKDTCQSLANTAANLLQGRCRHIFYICCWYEKYRDMYKQAVTDLERAQVTANYLDDIFGQ